MDSNDTYKLQYLLESIIVLLMLLTVVMLSFFSQSPILTITFGIIGLFIILIFQTLKKKGKWFKSKNNFSLSFTILQAILVPILLNMSYYEKIPIFIVIIYLVLIYVYITILNYKFNFK